MIRLPQQIPRRVGTDTAVRRRPASIERGMLQPVSLDHLPVIDLRFGSDRAVFYFTARPVVAPGDERTFDVVVDVQAYPFSGRVEDVALEADLRFFARNLARMTVPGVVVFGGERMVEMALSVEPQEGGAVGQLVAEVSVTAAGEPWPRLTMLLFDQDPFWQNAAELILGLLDESAP